MLQIVVLGSGLIPRGKGIAPCKDPFDADENLIKLIMNTNGMAPYAVSRRDGHKVRITYSNLARLQRMADFNNAFVATPEKTVQSGPVVPKVELDKAVVTQKEEIKVEEQKPEEPKAEQSVEEAKVEAPQQPEYNNSGYYNKKDKHNRNNSQSNNSFKPITNPAMDEEPKSDDNA